MTTYKALSKFRTYQPGDEFEADLDPALERRAIERGSIKKLATKKANAKTKQKEG